MQTLYKFILDADTGRISVQEITDYEEGYWTNHKKYWRYRRGNWYYCYEDDLDRYKCGHVYSFNSDFDHAYKITLHELKSRADKAKAEYEKYEKLYNKAERWNNE